MMANRRRVAVVFNLVLLLLFVVVDGASSGLESAVVSSTEARSCAQHHDSVSSASSPDLDAAEACIRDFLKEQGSTDKVFHVQGWRWHTLSLARDARRLGSLASTLAQNATLTPEDKSLEKAVYHVVGFNMKALHRIENKTFFPWLTTQLSSVDDSELAQAFSLVLNDVVENQKIVSELGAEVVRVLIFNVVLVCSLRNAHIYTCVYARRRRLTWYTVHVLQKRNALKQWRESLSYQLTFLLVFKVF